MYLLSYFIGLDDMRASIILSSLSGESTRRNAIACGIHGTIAMRECTYSLCNSYWLTGRLSASRLDIVNKS
jgi:hypothetical protein